MFQSDRDAVARLRDLALLPAGRIRPGRTHMLQVLSGTQQGLFGRLALDPGFVEALGRGLAPARTATALAGGADRPRRSDTR